MPGEQKAQLLSRGPVFTAVPSCEVWMGGLCQQVPDLPETMGASLNDKANALQTVLSARSFIRHEL